MTRCKNKDFNQIIKLILDNGLTQEKASQLFNKVLFAFNMPLIKVRLGGKSKKLSINEIRTLLK